MTVSCDRLIVYDFIFSFLLSPLLSRRQSSERHTHACRLSLARVHVRSSLCTIGSVCNRVCVRLLAQYRAWSVIWPIPSLLMVLVTQFDGCSAAQSERRCILNNLCLNSIAHKREVMHTSTYSIFNFVLTIHSHRNKTDQLTINSNINLCLNSIAHYNSNLLFTACNSFPVPARMFAEIGGTVVDMAVIACMEWTGIVFVVWNWLCVLRMLLLICWSELGAVRRSLQLDCWGTNWQLRRPLVAGCLSNRFFCSDELDWR